MKIYKILKGRFHSNENGKKIIKGIGDEIILDDSTAKYLSKDGDIEFVKELGNDNNVNSQKGIENKEVKTVYPINNKNKQSKKGN